MGSLLTVHRLCKTFRTANGAVRALQDVTFQMEEGECLGVVGQSGCGKSTLVRLLLALEQPDSGDVHFCGTSLLSLHGRRLREWRQHIQVVFQNHNAALNHRLPIWRSILEPLDNFPHVTPPFLTDVRHSRRDTALRLLEMVGLSADFLDRYPHELSGGQRQRVAIARGISLNPKLLICDEPTSNLDVTLQVRILRLLKQMQRTLGMASLFISHDIAAVRMVSDRILVMREGQVVDAFPSERMLSEERHPYTKRLVAAAMER